MKTKEEIAELLRDTLSNTHCEDCEFYKTEICKKCYWQDCWILSDKRAKEIAIKILE